MNVLNGREDVARERTFIDRERGSYSELWDRQKGKGRRSDSVIHSKRRARRGIGRSHWDKPKGHTEDENWEEEEEKRVVVAKEVSGVGGPTARDDGGSSERSFCMNDLAIGKELLIQTLQLQIQTSLLEESKL